MIDHAGSLVDVVELGGVDLANVAELPEAWFDCVEALVLLDLRFGFVADAVGDRVVCRRGLGRRAEVVAYMNCTQFIAL